MAALGDWKNFRFEMIKRESYAEVFDHLENNFYQDEPMSQLLGSNPQKSKEIKMMVAHFLGFNLSICARHRETNKARKLESHYGLYLYNHSFSRKKSN